MADWYVFQHDGDYLGPWSTEVVAGAILAGKLGPDVWVAAPGGPRWVRALDIPEIARLAEGAPAGPRRRDSGLRLMPSSFRTMSAPARDQVEQTLEVRKSEASTTAKPRAATKNPSTTRKLAKRA